MYGSIVTPAQGIAFAILILGWLTCDHFGLDDRLMEAAMADVEVSESAGGPASRLERQLDGR